MIDLQTSANIEYSLCNVRQLAYFRLTIHKYTHLPSPYTVSDRVWSWPIEYSLCHSRQLRNFRLTIHEYTHLPSPDAVSQSFPLSRSSNLSASLGSFVTSDEQSTNILTCHSLTLFPTVFTLGSIGYSLCNFRQFGNFRIPFRTYDPLSSLPCFTWDIERIELLYSPDCRKWRIMEAPLQFRGDRIELLYSLACRKRRLMEEGGWLHDGAIPSVVKI